MSSQGEVVRREFGRQAAGFERPGSLFGDVPILHWIAAHVPLAQGARILDVAGGTGQTGRYLARGGATAVIVDFTDAMLEEGLRSVLESERTDVVFVRGDAADLPFAGGQFDAVVCRFALHHMPDPARAIAEMARVCRPGGSVTLIDVVNGGASHDELERLRDPSHTRALEEHELRERLAGAGHAPVRESEREQMMPVGAWLEQARTPAQDARVIGDALAAEARGGAPTGLRAAYLKDVLTITQRWVLIGG